MGVATQRIGEETSGQDDRPEHDPEGREQASDLGFVDFQTLDQREFECADQGVAHSGNRKRRAEEKLECGHCSLSY